MEVESTYAIITTFFWKKNESIWSGDWEGTDWGAEGRMLKSCKIYYALTF